MLSRIRVSDEDIEKKILPLTVGQTLQSTGDSNLMVLAER